MTSFALRNLKIFFRQKSAVFFSFLAVFIIIGLYVVFLGDTWASSFELPQKEILMNSWIIAGIVSITSITTTMGAFGVMVEDRVQKNSKDFFSAPIRRSSIVGGYLLSAYIISVLMSVFAFVLGELFIFLHGGEVLDLQNVFKMLGIIFVSAAASSSMVFFVISFFLSHSAFSTASTVLGTLIGFVTGVYIPIGSFPNYVQWIIKLFPVSHSAALMRQIMMEKPMQNSFAGIPDSYLIKFKETVGVIYTYEGTTATAFVHIMVLIGTAVLFFLLALWSVSRKNK